MTGRTAYDDLVPKGQGDVGYLIFGANYSAADRSSWDSEVRWLRVLYETKSEGKWLGLSLGGGMDPTGQGLILRLVACKLT